ncbi:hypothetical protein TNCT_266331 [Trichonephila clavata]|uniref:Uncharacterized protein n=1 Tax=Trichonephila clavata TaxID=2740835 RepID=A0A8X6F6F1_TRICU|nr:hypothetical protein TNCT_266331 [Trichonephila clavata]
MRDDLAFAHCLVKYSSPDFGEFAAFLKEFRNRLNAIPIPEVLTVQGFRRHFHDLDALCNVLCPSGESGKLRSLPFLFAVEPFKSKDLVLHKMAERDGATRRRLHSGHLDRMHET